MQHASRLLNGLGRSSCEGIVRRCWILAEKEGPSCSSMGWERKNEWSRTNTKGTSSIISKGCHWGRPPESHIKLTGRSCLKQQCTHMGFNNVELINYQWFSWASRIVCVLCIDGRASCFYASAGMYSFVRLKRAELPFFIWIKGGANNEPTTPVHKKRVLIFRILVSLGAFMENDRIAF